MSDEKVLSELKALRDQVAQLSTLINMMAMSQNLKDLAAKSEIAQAKPVASELSRAEILERLESAAEVRDHKDGRFFLLHHPTEGESTEASSEYEATEGMIWYASMPRASDEQEPGNPLVSVWVPDTNVVSVKNAAANNAQFGESMDNPAADRYEVAVRPGTYEVYQKVRQQ